MAIPTMSNMIQMFLLQYGPLILPAFVFGLVSYMTTTLSAGALAAGVVMFPLYFWFQNTLYVYGAALLIGLGIFLKMLKV